MAPSISPRPRRRHLVVPRAAGLRTQEASRAGKRVAYVRIGIAGPVGSGKTALVEALAWRMAAGCSTGAVANDILLEDLA